MGETNALPFTAKLSKERIKLCKERCDEYNELCAQYMNIEEDKRILAKKNSDLQTTHDALQKLTALCQCQSDDDQQLANNEVTLTELDNKFNDIATIEMGDIRNDNNNNDNQNVDQTITMDDELLQILLRRIKTIKARIDMSKQLIKVGIQLKLQYEASNSKLKLTMASCHCAEDGDDEYIELQNKYLEEGTSNDGNKQHYILREGCNAANNKYINNKEIKESSIETYAKTINGDKKSYKCRLNGCDFVGPSLASLSIHRAHKHKRNKKKSKRFVRIKKRKIVQRKPLTQRNATVDNNVTVYSGNDDNINGKMRATNNNNANLVYDQIIQQNAMSAKNKEINQTTNQCSINNFDDKNINQIMDNSPQIALNHCTANSPEMAEQLSPVVDETLKRHFTGSGFTGEDGVELITHIQKMHINNQNSNSSAKQHKCYYSKCDFVDICRVVLRKHMENEHNYRNKTAKSTRKSFVCKYLNCKFASNTEKGLRIHFKKIHGKSVAKNITHGQLINRPLIESQIKPPIIQKPNSMPESTSAASLTGESTRRQTARKTVSFLSSVYRGFPMT